MNDILTIYERDILAWFEIIAINKIIKKITSIISK